MSKKNDKKEKVAPDNLQETEPIVSAAINTERADELEPPATALPDLPEQSDQQSPPVEPSFSPVPAPPYEEVTQAQVNGYGYNNQAVPPQAQSAYPQQTPPPPTSGYYTHTTPPQQQYQQTYQQQPPNYYPPNQPVPPYGQPPKRKIWPWVLLACVLVFVLTIGSCSACAIYLANVDRIDNSYSDRYDYDYYDDYYDDYNDDYNYGYTFGYTLDEIYALGDNLPNNIDGKKASAGVYEVGKGKDIEPGFYFFEGSQDEESWYTIFEKEDSLSDQYDYTSSVAYFGNYYTYLKTGDVIFFEAAKDCLMYPETESSFKPEEPYQSGCYKVGEDIAAGTYLVTYQKNDLEYTSQDSAVYIMKDLEWEYDSIVESHDLIEGGSHTITIEDGQYVELYLATMTAAPAASE